MSTFSLGFCYSDLELFETHLQGGSPLKNSHDYHSFLFNIVGHPVQFCWESIAHIKVACELRQWKVVLKEKCLSKAQVEQKKIYAWLQENYAVCPRWWKKEREAVTLVLLLVLFNWFDIVLAPASIPEKLIQNDEFGFQTPVTEGEPLNFWSSGYKERPWTQLEKEQQRPIKRKKQTNKKRRAGRRGACPSFFMWHKCRETCMFGKAGIQDPIICREFFWSFWLTFSLSLSEFVD